MALRLVLTLVTGETRVVRRAGVESAEQALVELGEWLLTDEGGWVQRRAIAEVRIEAADDDELDAIAAAELERPLSDQEEAALSGTGNLEEALEGQDPPPA